MATKRQFKIEFEIFSKSETGLTYLQSTLKWKREDKPLSIAHSAHRGTHIRSILPTPHWYRHHEEFHASF
jgi:hypothetical protein